jgi:hypothetical protein
LREEKKNCGGKYLGEKYRAVGWNGRGGVAPSKKGKKILGKTPGKPEGSSGEKKKLPWKKKIGG